VILVADTSASSHVEPKSISETIPPSAPPLTEVEAEIEEEAPQISNDASLGAPAPPLQPSADPEFDNVLSGKLTFISVLDFHKPMTMFNWLTIPWMSCFDLLLGFV
jgi:hypothetical protein